MLSQCPHLGAPLESVPIRRAVEERELPVALAPSDKSDGEAIEFEDDGGIEDSVIVCPWHEYDFDLKMGESKKGLKACTFKVRMVADLDGS